MSRLLRNIVIWLVVIVVVAAIFGWRFLSAAGYFTGIHAEVPADCTSIASVPGPEDIQIDHERGLAFVSALDWRAMIRGEKAIRGGIYVIDLKQPRDKWVLAPVTPNEPADFKPHGLSLYIGPDGKRRLFVVNHATAGNAIEIFDVGDGGTLTYVKSVSSPLLASPNDVVAVGSDAFYVTNDHASKGLGAQLGDLLLLRNANVVYYDGDAMRIVADTLLFPNGINVSPDGKTIYVGETLGAALDVYTRDPATGALTGRDYTKLGTGLDNIDVEPDGSLLIAAHPNMIAFLQHASNPAKLSPSQIVRIEPGRNGGGKAGTIYLNLGEQLSGSSVAAGFDDLMLIGSVFEPKILVCKQSKEFKSF